VAVLLAADAESFRFVPALLIPSVDVRVSLVPAESGELSDGLCCKAVGAEVSGANRLSTEDGCVEEDSDTALSTDGNRKAPSLPLLRVGDGEVA